jgi:ABC-type nitrate/sulfonate/bicarbonate transport system substrate-binding protein
MMTARWMTAALVCMALAVPAQAQNPPQSPPPVPHPHPLRELKLITFGGASNLPLWAAQRQGFLAQEGLEVRISYTPNSVYQMTQLLAGTFDIATTAIDNVIAYQEGQNEAPIGPNPDLFVFASLDNAFLTLVSQGPLKTVESLRGKTLTVDAMTTGYAFVLRELLARAGIKPEEVTFIRTGGTPDRLRGMIEHQDQAATIQGTPFEFIGESRGLNTLLRVDQAMGPYQGFVATARRGWAATHHDDLVGFDRAMIRAIDWLYDPANRPIAEALLIADVPGMSPDLARKTYDVVLASKNGFFRDLTPDDAGIRQVLALRTKYGQPHKDLTDPAKYLDMSYRTEALANPKPAH